MQSHTTEELANIKDQWKSMKDLSNCQNMGYLMHLKYLGERDQRKVSDEMLTKCHRYMSKMHIDEERTQNVANILYDNLKDLIDTIEGLNCKKDGTPINNEMAQVLGITKMIKEKYKKEIKEEGEKYKHKLKMRDEQNVARYGN